MIQEQTIDLAGKSLGRTASEVAAILRGKSSPDFQPNVVPSIKVKVVNASKMKITEKKKSQKIYTRYSGHPSGLKKTKLGVVFADNPGEVFRRAVLGMLSRNKLRSRIIKNLTIEN